MRFFYQYLFIIALVSPIYLCASSPLNDKEKALIEHVISSIDQAERLQSKLDPEILKLEGMSGWKVRHFLNNVASFPNAVYFEVGSYKGSTLISALYRNQNSIGHAIAVDNWSQFGAPRAEFIHNIQNFLSNDHLSTFDMDCFSLPIPETFPSPVNIYFYDGNHDFSDQQKAFVHFNSIFDDVFIAIVDDWNWGHVRDGTHSAFIRLNYDILFQKEIFTNANGDSYGWWNGMCISVIRKNK